MQKLSYEWKIVCDITDFITLVNCNKSLMIKNQGFFHAKYIWSWGLSKINRLINQKLLYYAEIKN